LSKSGNVQRMFGEGFNSGEIKSGKVPRMFEECIQIWGLKTFWLSYTGGLPLTKFAYTGVLYSFEYAWVQLSTHEYSWVQQEYSWVQQEYTWVQQEYTWVQLSWVRMSTRWVRMSTRWVRMSTWWVRMSTRWVQLSTHEYNKSTGPVYTRVQEWQPPRSYILYLLRNPR